TLFLDEIGDMPQPMQAKLLRVLEQGEVERVGGDKAIAVNVRVIVATHRNLEEAVREAKFRQDLFHRIYVFPIHLPALRDRKEDIPALVAHFAHEVCAQNTWKPAEFAPDAIKALKDYAWPGNVRDLRNAVQRLILLSPSAHLTPSPSRPPPAARRFPPKPLQVLSPSDPGPWPSACRPLSARCCWPNSSGTITTLLMLRKPWISSAAMCTRKRSSWE